MNSPVTIRDMRTLSGETVADSWSWSHTSNTPGEISRADIAAQNRAKAKFDDKLGDSSSFGATLTAERKETFGMVVSTVLRCAKAAREVKALRFARAARTLGLPYREFTVTKRHRVGSKGKYRYIKTKRRMSEWDNRRAVVKTAASGWLMWSYGVKPLMDDIYNGVDVLQRPNPRERVRGSGRSSAVISGSGNRISSKNTTRFIADVRVVNPNLWTANQLGLINPVSWGLEAIPLSFVVDWFSNLSQVVSQLTDYTGLSLDNPLKIVTTLDHEVISGASARSKSRLTYTRTIEKPSAKLQFAYERFHWQRGLNAISLLIGVLPRK